jgi:predicted nucleic acid-binding protein
MSMMQVYLDNCVVSGMVRGDLAPGEMAVMPKLKAAVDEGRLQVVTSRESWREQDRATDPTVRAMLEQARREFPLVKDEELLGFNIQDEPGTFISSPLVTEYVDADLYEKFKKAGLDGADARHLMYAVHNKCDRFVTTDPNFLSRRSQLKMLCHATKIVTPSELAVEL